MDLESIKKKVGKLLSLSGSDNEHEATVALEQAHKLLAKYNLEMSDIKEEETDTVKEDLGVNGDMRNGRLKWHKLILMGLAPYNYCGLLSGYRGRVSIVGKPYNVEIVREMAKRIFKWVSIRSRLKYPGDRYQQLQFKTGCAETIMERLEELLEERKRKEKSTALVVLNTETDELVAALSEGRKKNLPNSRRTDAHYEGVDEGLEAPIHKEID